MIVTVDINVLLDVFQHRQPHYAASARILAMVQLGILRGVFPAHGFTTLYYLIRKHATRPAAKAAMDQILAHFEIGNLDASGWARSRSLPLADFEDAVVAVVAETTRSKFIITRNVGDFAHSPIPAIAPLDFLSQFVQP